MKPSSIFETAMPSDGRQNPVVLEKVNATTFDPGRNREPNTGDDSATAFVDIVFFDGVCGLCNRFVDFVITRDSTGIFRFAPLQGPTASARLNEADIGDLNSVVLIDRNGIHRKSSAVLHILSRLGGFWKLVAVVLQLVPRPLRDAVYSWIARHRYVIFGKKETCRMPTVAERARFLP